MKKHHSLLALAMLLSSIAFTQNSFQKQINAVGGSVSDPRMAAIDGGGTIITGSYVSSRVSLNKVMLAKLDKDGEPLWARAFGSDNANHYPLAVIPCRDGGFVVTESLDVGFNVFVVKYTGTGVLSWQRKFNYSASGYYSMYLRAGICRFGQHYITYRYNQPVFAQRCLCAEYEPVRRQCQLVQGSRDSRT